MGRHFRADDAGPNDAFEREGPCCPGCGGLMDWDDGSPGGREEPPTAASWYCADCAIFLAPEPADYGPPEEPY